MAKPNSQLTAEARASLAGRWPLAIGTMFVFGLVNSIGGIISLIIGGPMQLGASIFTLSLARGKEAEFTQIFDGFKKFGEALVAYLLMVLYVVLWSLLFIIPGIIAALSYSQTFYILADKDISGSEALKESKEMMRGNKGKLFWLGFRFLGWAILCIFTLGIGFLWLIPYIQVTMANFYEDIKA